MEWDSLSPDDRERIERNVRRIQGQWPQGARFAAYLATGLTPENLIEIGVSHIEAEEYAYTHAYETYVKTQMEGVS